MTRALVVLAAVLGCAPLATIGMHTPPPSICSRPNVRAMRVELVLQDNEHHLEWIGNADPGGHVCAVWDLPGDLGRWGMVSPGVKDVPDTTWDAWFQAWALR
jgi:hypothetical protein